MKLYQSLDDESGIVMIEAVIYFPIVICMVAFLLYFGMFLLQEAAMNCQLQRFTTYASKNTANPGYQVFPFSTGSDFEFSYEGDTPSSSQVDQYYMAYHNDIGALYRGVSGLFSDEDYDYDSTLVEMVNNGLLFRFDVSPSVEVKKTLFGTSIVATVEYSIPTPGAIRYLGLDQRLVIRSASYCHAVNPSDFIRNTDLAVDLVEFAADKLGISDTITNIINQAKEKVNALRQRIGGD